MFLGSKVGAQNSGFRQPTANLGHAKKTQVVLHGDDVPKLPGSANMLSPRSSVAKKTHLALLAFVCFTWACLYTTYIVLSETLVSDFLVTCFFSRFLCFQLRPRIDRVARGCLEGYHHLSGLPDSELNQGYFRVLFRKLMIFQASQTTYPIKEFWRSRNF